MQRSARGQQCRGARWFAAALLVALAAPAGARSHGIAGYSGMSAGLSCGNTGLIGCHVASGTPDPPGAPTVRFEGTTQLDPGATGTYRFVVVSQAPSTQTHAGFDVAASGGTLAVVGGQGEQIRNRELTHTSPPKTNDDNGEAAWEFTWQAPATAGEYVLFGAGNSVNFDAFETGDASAITTLMITVGNVAPTPTPTVTALPSATPPPAGCAGDCNGNGAVAVNELVASVNIALGASPVEACAACDVSGDGTVSVNELVAAVNNALNGCA